MTAVWRLEAPKLLGALARLVRDIDLAQDMAQEALLAALEHWPTAGIPVNPAAWLMTAAKNRALDETRRQKMMRAKHDEIQHTSAQFGAFDAEQLDVLVHDDVLRLMLISCHPVLPAESRLALTLRLVAGLSTAEIARALLSNEPAVAQRIVRAKRTIAEAKVPFELPAESELSARISPVLEVIYLIFNEGYAATRGDDLIRPELCDEALRLARILASLVPTEAEVHGLVSLMELQASRARAHRRQRRAHLIARPESSLLGFATDRARPSSARSCAGAASALRPVHAAGRDRSLPRASAQGRAH